MSDDLLKNTGNKKSAYVLGGIIGLVISLAAMLLFATVLLFFGIDRAYAAPFATISVGAGSFFASKVAARKIGDKGYLTGLIVGMITFALITAVSLILGNGLSLNTLFHFVIIMLASVSGGILGVNKKQKKYI